jgi:hypothetical protein
MQDNAFHQQNSSASEFLNVEQPAPFAAPMRRYRLIDGSLAMPALYSAAMRALVYTAPEKVEMQSRPRQMPLFTL